MSPSERIGRLEVGIDPAFDKKELFRQIEEVSKTLPKLTLRPQILAKDVNKEIRVLNTKKLVALNLNVNISKTSINNAIRKYNASPGNAAIQVDVKFSRAQINRALKAASIGLSSTASSVNKQIEKADKDLAAQRKGIWERSTRDIASTMRKNVDFERRNQNELKNLWINASRIQRDLDKKRIKDITTIDKKTKSSAGNIFTFAKNIILLRSAFGLIRISTIATGIGFLAQAAAAATASIVALTAAIVPGLAGGLVAAAGGALAFGQAMKVVQFATVGIKDALGGANGLNKNLDPKKFARLTPAAKDFVVQLQNAKETLRGVQQLLQEELFKGLSDSIKGLGPTLSGFIPPLRDTATLLGSLAISAGNIIKVMGPELTSILNVNNVLIRNLGNSALELSSAFITLLTAAGPFLLFLSGSTRELARNIRLFTEVSERSGRLANFFDLAAQSLSTFGRLLDGLGGSLFNILRASLPIGLTLFDQLADGAQHLADITGSGAGQKSLTEFFAGALPAIEEMGLLLRDLTKEFLVLASQPGLVILLKVLREELLPVIGDLIEKITTEFGPVILRTLTNLALLLAQLVSQAGPLNNLARAVGDLAGFLAELFKNNPLILQAFTYLLLFEAAVSAAGVALFIFGRSGIGTIIKTIIGGFAAATTGVGLFTEAAVASGTASTLAFGPVLAAIVAIGAATAVVATQIDDWILKLGGLAKEAGAVRDSFNEEFGKNISTSQAARLADLGVSPDSIKAKTPLPKQFGPEIPKTKKLSDAEKQLNDVLKRLNTSFKLNKIGVDEAATASEIMATKTDFAKAAAERLQAKLPGVEKALSKQKIVVDKLAESLSNLRNIQLLGTKAFSDQSFAIQQQIKALELQQTNLKIGGLTDQSREVIELQKQIEALQLQSTKTDLTESLKLDPLRRKFDELINPIKELSFEDAVNQFKTLTAEHSKQVIVLEGVQAKYDNLNARIKTLQESSRKFMESTRESTKALVSGVTAPEVITKPFKSATKSLSESSATVVKSVKGVRGNIRKPFEQAMVDINNLFLRLPTTAGPGLTAATSWSLHAGQVIGNNLIRGLMSGMRSFLVKDSPLYNLLHVEIPNFIKDNKGPVAYDRTILVPAGQAIMEGLTHGLRQGFDPVKGFLSSVGPSMEEFVPQSMFANRTAQFLVDVAAGNKPDVDKFFADLVPTGAGDFGGDVDPSLGFLHKSKSLADTGRMANSLAKTFGLTVTALKNNHSKFTSSGNISDHFKGLAADLSNGVLTPQEDALAAALKPLQGSIIKQLIWRNKDQANGAFIPGHLNHVHVAFNPANGFSLNSGKFGNPIGTSKPSAFEKIFQAASSEFNVPSAFLKAITKAESNFNPKAHNPSGASGLMQLIPSTFKAQHVGNNIFDPKQNIFAGAKFLSALLREFKGNKLLAAAGYNAGPGNVHRYGGVPPFKETLNYVKKVIGFFKDFGGFREHGGGVKSNKGYWVGERGPEWFQPGMNGHITSNRNMTKSMTNNNGGNIFNTNVTTASQNPQVVADLIEANLRRRLARLDQA